MHWSGEADIPVIPQNYGNISENLFAAGGNIAIHERIRMWFELLNLILGIAFGFFHKGEEDYYNLLKNGVVIGLVFGSIFVLVAPYFVSDGMFINTGFLGTPGIFIEIFVFVVIFILGTLIGDKIEMMVKK